MNKITNKGLERRYRRQPLKREDERVKEAFKKASLKNLELMRKEAFRPEGISYYEEIISTELRQRELKDSPGKVIGSFCIFTPEELIYAAQATPVRLCAGFYDTISVAEEILPRDICPLVKSSFGFKVAGFSYFELCDAVIVPTPCDPKKKLGEILSDYLTVFPLKIPQDKSLTFSKELWFREIKILKERLEELTGNKITREKLKGAIELLHKRQAVFRRFYEIRKHNPALVNGRDAQLIIQSSFYDDIKRWIEKTEDLCNQLSNQPAPAKRSSPEKSAIPKRKLRLLLTGAPVIWPNYKVLNIVEEAEAVIVADELCSGTRALYDPVEVDEWTMEGMLRAITNRYLLPSNCPCFIESDDRIDKLLQTVEDFKVDGVIHHSLRLCQIYDMELSKVAWVFKDKGIPFLSLHTDYSLEDVEQIRTRVEAFWEMIRS